MSPPPKQLLDADDGQLDLSGPGCNPTNERLLNLDVLAQLAGTTLVGCLARIGIVALFTGSKQSAFPVIWAQALGNFVFGFVVHRREDIISFSPEAFIALRVGFAGSIATFATWESESFQAVTGFKDPSRSWLHNATDFISQVLVTLAVAAFSLGFGRHVRSHMPQRLLPDGNRPWTRRALSIASLLLWLVTLLTFILSPASWRTGRRVSLSLVLGPPATWLRWWLAASLNPRSPPWVKWGTVAANMLSTLLLATAVLLQYVLPSAHRSLMQCQGLQALQDGFCGCLSTIPAFLEHAEIMDQRETQRWYAWTYLTGMYVGGLLCVIVVLGVGWWTHHGDIGSTCVY